MHLENYRAPAAGDRVNCWEVLGPIAPDARLPCCCVCGTKRRVDLRALLTGPKSCGCQEDFFTPAWCVDRLLEASGLLAYMPPALGPWIDPCCGAGAIPRAVNAYHENENLVPPGWLMQDIRADCVDRAANIQGATLRHGDFLTEERWDWNEIAGLITNPPFSLATAFVKRALERCNGPIAFLLQLGWLASQGRAPMLIAEPPDVYILPNRPSFTADGHTDSRDYFWGVWGRRSTRPRRNGAFQVLALTPEEERCG